MRYDSLEIEFSIENVELFNSQWFRVLVKVLLGMHILEGYVVKMSRK